MLVRQFKNQKEFEDVIFADKIVLTKEEEKYEKKETESILITFLTAPYSSLLDRLRKKINPEKTDNHDTLLYMRYKDSEDTWELGYVSMSLDLWKFIEDIFYNYKPSLFYIREDKLVKANKIDFIHTGSFEGSEQDGFIE